MKLLFESWRKYLKEQDEPLSLGFDVVTIEDLANPFKYINLFDEKKWIVLELFKAFRQMIDAIKVGDEESIRRSLQALETMSNGGLSFKDEKEAYSVYNDNNLRKVHRRFEKVLNKLTSFRSMQKY